VVDARGLAEIVIDRGLCIDQNKPSDAVSVADCMLIGVAVSEVVLLDGFNLIGQGNAPCLGHPTSLYGVDAQLAPLVAQQGRAG
jgi:hypothetical protein